MNDHVGGNNGDDDSAGVPGGVVVIGESNSSTQISIQTLQGIYNEITGKTETVGKSYGRAFQIQFSDVEQLNRKLEQAHAQYNVVSSNCNITVFYADDTRDVFSSFARFALHNAGSSSSVESVLLKYNILVCLPNTRQAQAYTISVRLMSRIAVSTRIMSDFHGSVPSFLRYMGNRTALVEIEYVDYMVARNFLNIVDDWFKVLPTAFESKVINWMQVRSHLIPRFLKFATAVFVGLLLVFIAPHYVPKGTTDLLMLVRFSGIALLTVYAAHTIAGWFAKITENGLDMYSELSYLKFTKGDEKEIANAMRENKFAFVKSVGGFVLTICVSIVTKVIASHLTS